MNAPWRPRVAVRTDPIGRAPEIALDLLREHRDATLYHLPEWQVAVDGGSPHESFVVTVECEGEARAVCPVTLVRSRLFGDALVGSAFAVGGGALFLDFDSMWLIANGVCEFARERGVPVELRGGDPLPSFQSVTGRHVTFRRAIGGTRDDLLKAIPRKQRAEVRRALGNDLSVTHGLDEEQQRAHYAVYAQSVRNLGTPVFPRELFRSMIGQLGDRADIAVVRDGAGDPVSAVLSFFHRDAVMPVWGGGTRAARGLRANDRMYFAVMEDAVRRGCTLFDFGRSKVGSGPAAYKKTWGFEPRPLTYQTWEPVGVRPRDVDPASGRHQWKTELWKRLPLGVANRLGPLIARDLA